MFHVEHRRLSRTARLDPHPDAGRGTGKKLPGAGAKARATGDGSGLATNEVPGSAAAAASPAARPRPVPRGTPSRSPGDLPSERRPTRLRPSGRGRRLTHRPPASCLILVRRPVAADHKARRPRPAGWTGPCSTWNTIARSRFCRGPSAAVGPCHRRWPSAASSPAGRIVRLSSPPWTMPCSTWNIASPLAA